MKTSPCLYGLPRHRPRGRAGFTLTEVMVAAAVFSLVIVALISASLFGWRMFNVTVAKLTASAYARTALNDVRNDIRTAKILYVGSGDNLSFSRITGSNLRQGNALMIYPTIDTNAYIRYYLDTTAQKLKRVVSGSSQVTTVASCVTNQIPFAAEDYAGNILTNSQNNRVIKMYLEFYQSQFSGARTAAGADSSRVQTRITRRAIE